MFLHAPVRSRRTGTGMLVHNAPLSMYCIMETLYRERLGTAQDTYIPVDALAPKDALFE